ncbi:MAG TPA: O-antigen ligase family protein [Hyphomicrobium sp.]|uniref:hypothetical protein n=1 Tax=Hyphomicrobium sp. TaxID=82 RepID=UPI002B6D57F4|nr:hypothetical protein [Hyphomicrobium sp.]HRN87732.1 O-antigen ligase family protein [Hyphomicrobium sp.]
MMVMPPACWPTRGFLVGAALTTPFLVNIVPTWIAALFALPLLADIAFRGIRLRAAFRLTPLLGIIYALALANLLAIETTPYKINVVYAMIWSGATVGLFLLAMDEQDRPDEIIKGLFSCLAPIAALFAVAGLIKHVLQIEGYVFASLIDTCVSGYPQGTSFCGDYNLYALFLAVGAIGLSVIVLSRKHSIWMTGLLLVALSAVLCAGFYVGSRRFMFVVLLVPMLWVAYALWSRPPKEVLGLALIPLIVTSALYAGVNQRAEAMSDYRNIAIEEVVADWFSKVIGHTAEVREDPREEAAYEEPKKDVHWPRTVSPEGLAKTMTPSEGFGLASRLDRWSLGLQLVEENNYVSGSGFSYHEVFACRFVNCEHIDYPHSPILSAWIGFGIVGLLLALGFYAVTIYNLFVAGKAGLLSGASAVTLAVMPYSFISGDTIFSLPHTMIGALLIEVSARTARRTESSGQ